MFKIMKICMLIAIGANIIACVPKEDVNGYLDSSAVTNTVKTKLVNQLGAQGLLIRVKTYRDEVQLTGSVGNQKTKHQAGLIAASVDNVKHVRNDLTIK